MVRLKHRYLLTELVFADGRVDSSVKWGELLRAIRDAVALAHGDFGYACVTPSLQVKYYNAHTGILLLRVSRDHYQMLWTAITLITRFGHREVLHVAGTIRKCQKQLLLHQQRALKAQAAAATNAVERNKIEVLLQECTKATIS